MVSDSSGNPKGFWSIHVYATDPTQSNAPFIAQTSVLNTSYSTADTAVLSVDAAAEIHDGERSELGNARSEHPHPFRRGRRCLRLDAQHVYYVASRPIPNVEKTTYTFQISKQWLQELSNGDPPVPIQDSGEAGPIVDLLSPAGAGALIYGMVKPVTQLGSSQLDRRPIGQERRRVVNLVVRPNAAERMRLRRTGFQRPIQPTTGLSTPTNTRTTR